MSCLFTFQEKLIDNGEFPNVQKPQLNKVRKIVSKEELYIRCHRLRFSFDLPDGLRLLTNRRLLLFTFSRKPLRSRRGPSRQKTQA